MIDTKELRRLAQAATPGPWAAVGLSFGESLPKYLHEVVIDREGDEDEGYSICGAPIRPNEKYSDNMAFIAAANPAVIIELLDRLEEAESDALEQARLNGMGSEREAALMAKLEAAEKERDTLRAELAQLHKEADKFEDGIDWIQRALQAEAKIEAMERQEPVAWIRGRDDHRRRKLSFEKPAKSSPDKFHWSPLYALPGAQNVPDVDALAQFIREIDGKHRLGAGALAERIVEWLAAAPEANPCP